MTAKARLQVTVAPALLSRIACPVEASQTAVWKYQLGEDLKVLSRDNTSWQVCQPCE